jgi:DNA-binding transcriptional ArsR family regulator
MKQQPHPEPGEITLTGVLAALGDPVRLSIVARLAEGERGSSDFDCNVASSTLSHHVKALREAGILHHRKEGTRCYVSLRPDIEKRFPGLMDTILRLAREP